MKMRCELVFSIMLGALFLMSGVGGLLAGEEAEMGETAGERLEPVEEEEVEDEGGLETLRVKEASFEGKVVVIPIKDDDDLIIGAKFEFMRRMLDRANEEGAEAVILDINTPGGLAWQSAQLIMDDLATMKVPTYTYVNPVAVSAGAIIAVGTDTIYMAPTSAIGAALTVSGGGVDLGETMEKKIESINKAQVRSVAKRKGHNVAIAEGFVSDDKDVVIEVGDDEKENYPMGVKVLSKKGEVLSLDHEEATEVINGKPVFAKGIAKDIEDLAKQEGLVGEIIIAKPLGFENLAMWVTRLAPILLIVAIAGAYMEYNAPGFGLPGIVSVVAFSIFFFGHYLAGKLAGFEIVAVFVLGIVLIGVEIFLFPGVIVVGLAGVLMVFGALLYTMAGAEPGGGALSVNLSGLKGAVRDLGISLLGATALIAVLMRYMKHVPGFNRLVLSEAIAEGPALGVEGAVAAGGGAGGASRVGETGVTTTDLRPAGKGRFGDDMIDIVSDGDFIGKNVRVRIVAQEGARVVVTELPS